MTGVGTEEGFSTRTSPKSNGKDRLRTPEKSRKSEEVDKC